MARGRRGVVSKPLITIHSKDDLPRPSPGSSRWGRSGSDPHSSSSSSSLDADEIPRTRGAVGGVPWDRVCCCICCPLRAHRATAVGISSMPLPHVSPPRLWDLRSFSRCTVRLCEERLANIDSSWRRSKGGKENGLSVRRGGIIGAPCSHEWFMQYKVAYAFGGNTLGFSLLELFQIFKSLGRVFPSN